jgi:uncharacterized membrane protein
VYTHYDTDALVCTVGDCGTVQSSDYATIGPIPIAIPGLGMYLTLALLAVSRLGGLKAVSLSTVTIAAWTIILAAVLYAAYLTYVEIWVIDAICQWCVASAIVSVVILALESLILWRVVIDEPDA